MSGPDPKPRSLPHKIEINFIDHKDHRYETVGDYFESGEVGNKIINVSKMKDRRFEYLVAIHELIEMALVEDANIPFSEIDGFDKAHLDDEDPGSLPNCPYRVQHMIAMSIEMLLATQLGVDWRSYEEYLDSL